MENLCEALKNIGLPDESVEFIRKSIDDSKTMDAVIEEIENGKIFDKDSFSEFFRKNFRIIPNISNIPECSENSVQNNADTEGTVPDNNSDDEKSVAENQDNKKTADTDKADEKKPLSNTEVTQHTASLWKYQPVNPDEPETNEEYIINSIHLPYADIIGASVRGKKHKHDGSDRDDWFEMRDIGEIAVIAVSDGAGSKKFSGIGAKVSCKAAVEAAEKLVMKLHSDGNYEKTIENISAPLNSPEFMNGCGVFADIIQQSVIAAYDAVQNAFEERKSRYEYLEFLKRDMNVRDFSATLLLMITVPVNDEQFVISCQIGDGMIAAVSSFMPCSEAVKLLGEADGGAFAGETDFLTSESMKRRETLMGRTRIARRKISDILIMTDGVADDYYPNASQLSRLYTDLQLNNIIPVRDNPDKKADNDIISRIPEPVSYPWVNDNNIEIAINYSSEIAQSCGISTEDLWQNSAVINAAREKLRKADNISGEKQLKTWLDRKKLSADNLSGEEKLKIWLDNYVERGSFDDRTLVVCSLSGNRG